MVSERKNKMLRTHVAVSGLRVGRRLVGSWTLDLKPPVKRNVVPTGSGAESLELSLIDPAGRQTLILVRTLQIVVRGRDICVLDVWQRFHLTLKAGFDSST